MAVGAVMLVPVGVADAGGQLLVPWILAAALGVAVLSSAIPYTLEMEALRRLPAGVFGVMMSIEPAVAALAGFLLLDEGLATRELVAILLVVAASAGAARNAQRAAAGRLRLSTPAPGACPPGHQPARPRWPDGRGGGRTC